MDIHLLQHIPPILAQGWIAQQKKLLQKLLLALADGLLCLFQMLQLLLMIILYPCINSFCECDHLRVYFLLNIILEFKVIYR
jgi:hypothetical protein